MRWVLVALMASGVIVAGGLAWFFTEAWIFAVQARATWLIVLLAVTSTAALSAQGYLCVTVASTYRVMSTLASFLYVDNKSRGVTTVNREIFASFRFDETACLTRRRGSNNQPSVGWEVHASDRCTLRKNNRVDDEQPAESKTGLRCQWCGDESGAARGGADGACCCGRVGVDDGERHEELQETREEEGRAKCFSGNMLLSVLPRPSRRSEDGGTQGGVAGSLGVETGRCRGDSSVNVEDDVSVATAADASWVSASCGDREFRFRVEDASAPEVNSVEYVEPGGLTAPFALDGDNSTRPFQFLRLQQSVSSMIDKINGATGPRGDGDKTTPGTDGNGDAVSKLHRPAAASHRCFSRGNDAELGVTVGGENGHRGGDEERPSLGEERTRECQDGHRGSVNGIAREGNAVDADSNEYSGRVELGLTRAADDRGSLGRGTLTDTTAPRARVRDRELVRVGELPDVCAICLGQYATEEEVHVLPCLHIFHAQCLDIWISGHPSCPYCKQDLNVLPAVRSTAAAVRGNARRAVLGLARVASSPLTRFRDSRRQRRQRRERVGRGGGSPLSTPATATAPMTLVL